MIGLSLDVWRPGEVRHESPYTGAATILTRGVPRWRGVVVLAEENPGTPEHRAVERFLAACEGTRNIFRIPLSGDDGPRPTVDEAGTVQAGADGRFTLTAAPAGWDFGAYVRTARGTVYLIDSWNAAGRAVQLRPAVDLDPGTVLSPTTSIVARRLRTEYENPMDGDFGGPWAISWQESI